MSKIPLDRDGQPAAPNLAWHRNLMKSMSALLGLCAGVIADRKLNDEEITFLDAWLAENQDVAQSWPENVIAGRVQQVLADGVVTEDERADLHETLAALVGGRLEETGAASGLATRLQVDDQELTAIEGCAFCFTGKFIYGPRSRCEQAVVERGGQVLKNVNKKLDYLVVGTLASRDWAHTSYGRKIEKAQELKAEGHGVHVVAEETWTKLL